MTLIFTILLLAALAAVMVFVWWWAQLRFGRNLMPKLLALESAENSITGLLSQARYIRSTEQSRLGEIAEEALTPTESAQWRFLAPRAARHWSKRLRTTRNSLGELVQESNRRFVAQEMLRYQELFDRIENNPLTEEQRIACVTCEDSNLVLAGAGTGKTSTMIGRAGYLMAAEMAQPHEILMIAYARKAAEEMQERQDTRLKPLLHSEPPTIKTFHALGLEIISQAEGRRPSLTPMVEDSNKLGRFLDLQLETLCRNRHYTANLLRYFGSERYPYRNPFDFASHEAYLEYIRTHELRTLNGNVVKSFEECIIANFLSAHGVRYEYEHPYEVDTAGPDFRQYRPDFFLPDHRIYLEHFALDKNGNPPAHFDRDKYLQGIRWKRELHAAHGTTLLETYSHLKRDGRLEESLTQILLSAGVQLTRRTDEELLGELRDATLISELAELGSTFITHFKDAGIEMEELRATAASHVDAPRLLLLLDLFEPILHAYNHELISRGEIDFADMIRRAAECVESGAYNTQFKHILVDEFQDISRLRARLVLALLRQRPEAVLFAVGDDWQSIYRFAGSDQGFTTHFNQVFGPTATTTLRTTFRFNDKIGSAATHFVLKNPAQIPKDIRSVTASSRPEISMVRVSEMANGLRLALEAIASTARQASCERKSVLVLGRYHHIVDQCRSHPSRGSFAQTYPLLDLQFMTVHAAKGKEADFVVVVGLTKGKHGFPSEKPTDALLDLLLPAVETHPFAEERRLFYVALTRARHRVYLIYQPLEASCFVEELALDAPDFICTEEFDASLILPEQPIVRCPACGSGRLQSRTGRRGGFVGCVNFPYCRHTEKPCPLCGAVMMQSGEVRRCTDPRCEAVVPVCPLCSGLLVERKGRYGKFWGCSNFRPHGGFACNYTKPKT